MYSSYNYNPPASYYEPPEPPSYDREEARVIDDVFFLVLAFDGEEDDEGIEYRDSLEVFYKDIESYKEDGLTKMEVYEAVQDFGICYGKHEDDYYEEEISDMYRGDILYSEEF